MFWVFIPFNAKHRVVKFLPLPFSTILPFENHSKWPKLEALPQMIFIRVCEESWNSGIAERIYCVRPKCPLLYLLTLHFSMWQTSYLCQSIWSTPCTGTWGFFGLKSNSASQVAAVACDGSLWMHLRPIPGHWHSQ